MSYNQRSMNEPSDLIIGLVGGVGANLEVVHTSLYNALEDVNYRSHSIRLSNLLDDVAVRFGWELLKIPEDSRYESYMTAGTKFRKLLGRGDALAILAVGAIRDERDNITLPVTATIGVANNPTRGNAYILRSLKHEDEVKALRRIYGRKFVLVAAYSTRENREKNLMDRIADSRSDLQMETWKEKAVGIIQRDELEVGEKLGQQLRETFPLADVFIDTGTPDQIKQSIIRYVELLFGNVFHTPRPDELGMMHAQVAASRSSSLGRQVGAAITTKDGSLIAVGTNDVPKAGGGLYWPDDIPDRRDHTFGEDLSDNLRKRLFGDVVTKLRSAGWLCADIATKDNRELITRALEGDSVNKVRPFLRELQLMNLLEYGRSVHAEMDAITDSGRRGVALAGSVLYTTTFPCHNCARHIVAAGISRVIYIEPFPKSLVGSMYPDSIVIEGGGRGEVVFEPYLGVAPRQFLELFSLSPLKRKSDDGRVTSWERRGARLRFEQDLPPEHMTRIGEAEAFNAFIEQMEKIADPDFSRTISAPSSDLG